MASNQPGIVGPDAFPIRDPRQKGQVLGRCVNPPRYQVVGGMDGPTKWDTENAQDTGSRVNMFPVQKPTNVRGAHSTAERKVGK